MVDIAPPVLWLVDQLLLTDDNPALPPWFNEAILVLLPKKPFNPGVAGVGEVYRPEDLRPLRIVNTFNCILANVMRGILEPLASRLTGPWQRGFLPDRLIHDNIVDIDLAALQVKVRGDQKAR